MLETHVPTSTLGEYVSFHVLFNLRRAYDVKVGRGRSNREVKISLRQRVLKRQ